MARRGNWTTHTPKEHFKLDRQIQKHKNN